MLSARENAGAPELTLQHRQWGIALASDERGTKRTCPVTGKKFYDLNKDPVVSPYTGKSYPLSFFEAAQDKAAVKFGAKSRKDEDAEEDEVEEADVDVAAKEAGAEVISLDDAEDNDEDSGDDDLADVEDVEVDEDLGGDDDDTFLETDDEDEEIDFDVEVDEDER